MGRTHRRGTFDHARDRLLSEVHRCGVPDAAEEDAHEWLDDTVEYLREVFPSLTREELEELKRVGRNYIAPVIPHGTGRDATNREEWTGGEAPSGG